MEDLDWIIECETPDIGEDGLILLGIIEQFNKFPNNTYYARDKRLDVLRGYKEEILNIHITNPTVAFVATQWLSRLDNLIRITELVGKQKWYQKNIRKRIINMKKDIDEVVKTIHDSEQYWYNRSAEEIMEEWKN